MKATTQATESAKRARFGMFRTCDRIDTAKARHDPVLIADARTSMCDYRLALALALGRLPDRNGFVWATEEGQPDEVR